jgi:hypothetical protein
VNRPTGSKRLLFVLAANLLAFGTLFAVGEFAVRWHLEGSPLAALQSFYKSRSITEPSDASGWLVHDRDLGYKLNPAGPDDWDSPDQTY